MKIYTRTGDQGETSLFGGQRVAKDHDRIEAYGTIDELNAVLGVARAELAAEGDPGELGPLIDRLQHRLFDLGAELAAPSPEQQGTDLLGDADVAELEGKIDRLEEKLPPLKQFILPGGTLAASHLHVARCVCRRSERLIVALGHHEAVRDTPIRYVNRLADLLFVVARVANHAAGRPDVPWQKASAGV